MINMPDEDSVESLEDCFNGNTDEDSDDITDGGDEFAEVDSDDDFATRRHQQSYAILSEADIRQRQEDDIMSISSVLRISRFDAGIVLRHCHWSVTKLHDEWFANEERIRKAVGLLQNPVVEFPNAKELTCGICFGAFPGDDIYTAACGHPFCSSCWAGYISIAVNDGPRCLMLKCPDSTCDAAVCEDLINVLAAEDIRGKYTHYLLRSYVEDSRKVKWCPAAGCDYAVEFDVGSGSYDVTCRCSYSFCWKCTEEAHRPIDCETVENWSFKNTAVSEHMSWILANSKQCPQCRVPIKKNQGSMHITCMPPCYFEFCWVCLGPWAEHGKRTGGFYSCNCYETTKQGRSVRQGRSYDESEKRMAKNSLERYTHYYERWAANQSSRQKAMVDFQLIQDVYLEQLSDMQRQPESQLMFIIEAWSQIVECRRVLKWTYAYGYYLPEHEHAKRVFFEFLQGEAEANLERLHHCAEKEMQPYRLARNPSRDFNEFRLKLVNLTSVTGHFFKKLVEALENGLSDVESHGACSRTAPSRLLAL